ncbi:MAG: hypothetical protein AB4352_06875 [Hormoscilla sp.]
MPLHNAIASFFLRTGTGARQYKSFRRSHDVIDAVPLHNAIASFPLGPGTGARQYKYFRRSHDVIDAVPLHNAIANQIYGHELILFKVY